MPSFNTVTLIGHVAKDPEIKPTNKGGVFGRFSVASDNLSDKEKPIWFKVTVFDKTADFVGQYLKKGMLVFVQGQMTIEYYEKDGQIRQSFCIATNNIKILERKKKEQEVDNDKESDDIPF